MILGIGSYTFGWAVGVLGHEPAQALDEVGLLEKAEQAGVNLVQIGDNLPLHTFTRGRLERLRESAAQKGIELQAGARRLTPERVVEYCDICRRIGAKLLRFVVDDADYHPSPDRVTSIIRECLPRLEGITLAIENHDRFPAASLRRIIDEVDDERVGVCLDTANSLGAGEGLREVTQVLAPVTVNLHVKDFQVARVRHLMGFTVTGCPAGTGMVQLPWLLEELKRGGRCESAILEQWTIPEPDLEETIRKEAAWASQSLNYLKSYFT